MIRWGDPLQVHLGKSVEHVRGPAAQRSRRNKRASFDTVLHYVAHLLRMLGRALWGRRTDAAWPLANGSSRERPSTLLHHARSYSGCSTVPCGVGGPMRLGLWRMAVEPSVLRYAAPLRSAATQDARPAGRYTCSVAGRWMNSGHSSGCHADGRRKEVIARAEWGRWASGRAYVRLVPKAVRRAQIDQCAPYAGGDALRIGGFAGGDQTAHGASGDSLGYLPDLPLRLRNALSISRSACRLARSALLS